MREYAPFEVYIRALAAYFRSHELSVSELLDSSDWPLSAKGRRPNLSATFVDAVERARPDVHHEGGGDMQRTFGPQDVFHYAYAMFHSPGYRARCAEFLKID